jgi:tetratricopeptide (TPR) repeat protein
MLRNDGIRALAGCLLAVSALAAARPACAADSWEKALRKRGVDPSLLPNPVEVTPAIRAAARVYAGAGGGDVDRLRRVQSALFDPANFDFDYDARGTFTAAEALERHRGNCVAITNLFIAMAHALDMRVSAGFITPQGDSEKRGDLIVVAAHVVAVYFNFHEYVVFDFYRMRQDPNVKIRLLDDVELAALTLNNRGVEHLAAGDLLDAEREFEAVVKLSPDFAGAYGNLGVVRRRRGDVNGALDAYREALALDPRDPTVLGNLAALYRGIGLEREARAALELADLRLASPFTILARGDLEAADGNARAALHFYRKAARAGPKFPEPQIAIARLERAQGKPDRARRAAQRALRIAPGNAEAQAILDAVSPQDDDAER